jgi:hypothetical protein
MTDHTSLSDDTVLSGADTALALYRLKEWEKSIHTEKAFRLSTIEWLKLAVQRLEAMGEQGVLPK